LTTKRDLKEEVRDFGVLYFYDANPLFQHMAEMSIKSLRKFHPDWPIEVIEIPSTRIPIWKKTYRAVSFWKRQLRENRAGQDLHIVASKTDIMLNSPFQRTLYLDVDTIVMKPLDPLYEKALENDVVVTPLEWKTYSRREPWQPESWPYVMAGVMFYSTAFTQAYRHYINKMNESISNLPTADQFVVSLICYLESTNLKIAYEPSLQIDVLNLENHLRKTDYPKKDQMIDLSWNEISRFHVFHYNEYKPQYMNQIHNVWGDSSDK